MHSVVSKEPSSGARSPRGTGGRTLARDLQCLILYDPFAPGHVPGGHSRWHLILQDMSPLGRAGWESTCSWPQRAGLGGSEGDQVELEAMSGLLMPSPRFCSVSPQPLWRGGSKDAPPGKRDLLGGAEPLGEGKADWALRGSGSLVSVS